MGKVLTGRVALVTGAGRGIGRAIAERLAHDGALVIVHYGTSGSEAAAVTRAIADDGGETFAAQADLRDVAQIARMFDLIDAELVARRGLNVLDIVVNNAGILDRSPIECTDPLLFDRLFEVNAKGAFFVTQHALPRLRDGGRVVFVSSLASRVPFPDLLAYSMTKGSLDTLARTLAAHLRPRGITVNAVAPGPVQTQDGSPSGDGRRFRSADPGLSYSLVRAGRPDDIADAVAAIVSPDGHWITGQCIEVTGGYQPRAVAPRHV